MMMETLPLLPDMDRSVQVGTFLVLFAPDNSENDISMT